MEAIYPTKGFEKMEDHWTEKPSEIQEYFAGSVIFITGATGFLGKVLVEKLLRTCHDLKRVYILMRPKRNKSCEKRLEEYFNNPLYDRLKAEQPKSLEKLSVIMGDCELPDLGISNEDSQTIISEVDCIFHVAATVRFNEKLRTAAYINIKATRDILKIAKKIKHLKSLVHVSTAFSFCTRPTIEEVFYQPAIKAEDLLAFVDAVSEDQLTAMAPILMKEWPNTYVFTKAIAEDFIKREGADLPIAVVRPSIIMLTAKEPVAGWVDSFHGATGIFTGVVLGAIRTMCYRADFVADQVPADYVANNMIAAAWNMGSSRNINHSVGTKAIQDIPIYNCVCGAQNPITWEQCNVYSKKHVRDLPSMHMQWHYFLNRTPSRTTFLVLHYLLHVLPGYILDLFMIASGQKPTLVKTYQRVKETVLVLTYFTTRNWTFRDENTQALWKRLGDKDKELFEFNIAALDWDAFYTTFIYGTRLYLLKDPLDTLPQAKKKALRLKIAHYVLVLVLMYFALRFLHFLGNVISKFL